MKKLLSFFVMMLSLAMIVPAQAKAERRTKEAQKVKKRIETHDYTLIVDQVMMECAMCGLRPTSRCKSKEIR